MKLRKTAQPNGQTTLTAMKKATLRALNRMASAAHKKPGAVYSSPQEFVVRHGVWYEKSPYPHAIRPGAPNCCFGNAICNAVVFGFKYIEGYSAPFEGAEPILHAWNVDDDGALVDSTWMNNGAAYIGVAFTLGRADDATWNGDACVLNDRYRDWPLFKEEWNGEDWQRTWPESTVLAAFRQELQRDVTWCGR